ADPVLRGNQDRVKNLTTTLQTADMLKPSLHIGVLDSFFIAADPDTPFTYNPSVPQRGVFALAGVVTTNPGEHPHARHGSSAINILFGDGHASAFTVEDKYRPYETLNGYNTAMQRLDPNKINMWDTRTD
ncbi:MAG: hypothetical protein CUN57_01445, partial [Phototrophicales bacterium]